MRVFKPILLAILIIFIFSCQEPGTDKKDDGESSLTLKNPPPEGTNLPGSFEYELEYEIADSDYDEDHIYKIMAFFWTDETPFCLGELSLDKASGTVQLNIPFPSDGIPIEAIIPYRLYFTLTDSTDAKNLYTSEDDIIYDEMYTGTWYQIGTKVFIDNSSSIRYDYDFSSALYVPDSKGYHQRMSQNRYNMLFTHEWNSSSGLWEEDASPTLYEVDIDVNSQGELEVREEDGTLFQLLKKDEYTYANDFCGKWWSDDVEVENTDGSIILWLSDTEFHIVRAVAALGYPLHQVGTVSVLGNALTLEVSHVFDGTNLVPPASGIVYKFDYIYSDVGDPSLNLSVTGGDINNGFVGFATSAASIDFE